MPKASARDRERKEEMMRYCMVWNMDYPTTKAYFARRGYALAPSSNSIMRKRINDDEDIKAWFSDQALKAMEKDHKVSVDQYNELEKVLLDEIHQLTLSPVYVVTGTGPDGKPTYEFNKAHDVHKLTRAIQTFDLIKKSKSDIMMANPIVQAILLKNSKEIALAETRSRVDSHYHRDHGVPIPEAN